MIQYITLKKVANSVNVYSNFEVRNMTNIELLKLKIDMARDNVDFVLSDDAFNDILKSEKIFDLLILDYNMNEALLR